jgi:hypothetical protein
MDKEDAGWKTTGKENNNTNKKIKAETRKTNKQIETQTRYCEVSSVSGTHYYNSHHRVKTLFIFLLSFPILFILLFFLSVYVTGICWQQLTSNFM